MTDLLTPAAVVQGGAKVSNAGTRTGMSARQAGTVETLIVLTAVVSLALIFQPFSQTLFSVGCVAVVLAGLLFNLVPLCRPGNPARNVWRGAGIVLLILLVMAALGIGSAALYVNA